MSSTLDQKLLIKSILTAAEQGQKKVIQEYIRSKSVNVVDEENSTPLLYAAANGQEEIVRLLIDKECITLNKLEYNSVLRYIDQPNKYGWTALMQACCYGHLNVVISLIQGGCDVNVKNSWGASALVGACQGGFIGVVNKLLNVGAEINPSGDAETLTPVMAATQCGHLEVVEELLRRGAEVDTRLRSTGWTALMLAVLNNQLPVAKLLLSNGADKSIVDVNNQTAADIATALKKQDMVFLLTGQKPKEITESEFFEMVKSGDIERVSEVLDSQKVLANSSDKDGATPLMLAANKGNTKMCEKLLDHGANVNAKDDKYGWTALMLATHQRKYEVVEFLGKRGANINARGKSGSNAFDVANMISDIKMIRLVANISVEQIQSKTPDAPPPLAIPALSGGAQALREQLPTTNSKPKESKTPAPEPKAKPTAIDLTDLKHKLEKAYKTPTPNISVDDKEPRVKHNLPSPVRFPCKRPSSLLKPGSSSLSSSATSEGASPSSSSSSLPMISPRGRLPTDPFSERSKTPNSSFLKPSSRTPNKQTSRSPNSSGRNFTSPSLLQPRITPRTTSSGNFLKGKLKEPMIVPVRKRSDTAPASPYKPKTTKKKLSVPKPPAGMDLKNALEMESLGHLYPVFIEQELDTIGLLTLTVSDLKELGLQSAEVEKVLALITRLKSMTPKTPSTSPVFTFMA